MISEDAFHLRGIGLLYRSLSLIIQSVLYGIYASLVPVSAYIMINKGLRSLTQKILFGVIIFMFSLSTSYLAVTIADLIILIQTWYLDLELSESSGTRSPMDTLLVLFNSFVPINYVLTDGVVVWRAWVICRDEYKKMLTAPIVVLVLSMIGVIAAIGIRTYISLDPLNRDQGRLDRIIDVIQEITLIFSLITNVLGTGVIALKAWRYRRFIAANLNRVVNRRTKAERVLGILVESGTFYIFSGAMMTASSVIRLPGLNFSLGTIYSQAAVHLAGIYPLLVVILVHRESSMDKTLFDPTLQVTGPVVITDSQQASNLNLRAGQAASRQAESTPLAGLQFAAAEGPGPLRGPLDSDESFSQDSLAFSSSPDTGEGQEIQSSAVAV